MRLPYAEWTDQPHPFLCCYKYQGEHLNCFLVIVVGQSGLNKERRKMALSLPHTFVVNCLPQSFGTIVWVKILIIKALKEESWVLK